MPAVKKIKLNDAEDNFILRVKYLNFPFPVFELAARLNLLFQIRLKRVEDYLHYHQKTKQIVPFILFKHRDEMQRLDVFVLSNNTESFQIDSSSKQADYFLILRSEFETKDIVTHIEQFINQQSHIYQIYAFGGNEIESKLKGNLTNE